MLVIQLVVLFKNEMLFVSLFENGWTDLAIFDLETFVKV